jgi:hypothetical protein
MTTQKNPSLLAVAIAAAGLIGMVPSANAAAGDSITFRIGLRGRYLPQDLPGAVTVRLDRARREMNATAGSWIVRCEPGTRLSRP